MSSKEGITLREYIYRRGRRRRVFRKAVSLLLFPGLWIFVLVFASTFIYNTAECTTLTQCRSTLRVFLMAVRVLDSIMMSVGSLVVYLVLSNVLRRWRE